MGTATRTAAMEITELADGEFEVLSPSGNHYTVRYEGSGDGDPDYIALWSCTCPAYRFARAGRGLCKHINAVVALTDEN